MFNYVSVNFPQTTLQPQIVYKANLSQNQYSHELISLYFKDWGVQYDVVKAGSPVEIVLNGFNEKRNFYGYVHHLNLDRSPGKNFTEVTIIGASFPMKKAAQAVYLNTTADQVVKSIATKYNFVCYAIPHPRVYPQISQAGQSDWQLMVRLAKQCGYTLRANNTELYFQPIMEDYTKYRAEAPRFVLRPATHPQGSTIYSFKPMIGESIPYEDALKGAVAVGGVDIVNQTPISITQQIRNAKTRIKKQSEFFDIFDTSVVVPDASVATFESKAAESRNYFPYRGTVEVLGNPNLRPDMPVYLEGIGDPYDGFWVILSADHHIVEEERNRQKYTTTLLVGTDSLGQSVQWTDSAFISNPDYQSRRTIIPNVLQTKVVPQTELKKGLLYPTISNNGSFGDLKNRSTPSVNGLSNDVDMWQTKTSSLDPIIYEPRPPYFVTDRAVAKMGIL